MSEEDRLVYEEMLSLIISNKIKVENGPSAHRWSAAALTLFQYTGYQFGTALPFSLYLRHGFRSDSENVYGNRVKALWVGLIGT